MDDIKYKKKKTVTFNVVKLAYTEDLESVPKKYDFDELMKKFDHYEQADAISIIHNGENIIFQSCETIDLEERLYHLKVLKKRELDLPYRVKEVEINNKQKKEDVEENEIYYQSLYQENDIEEIKGSFIGEILNILFDAQNNVLIIQNNPNCTTTKGLEKLFTALHFELNQLNHEDFFEIKIAAIINPATINEVRKMRKYTEISYILEDNDKLRDPDDIINNPNMLLPQRLEVKQRVDTSSDKSKTFKKRDFIILIGSLLRRKEKIKKLEIKAREDSTSNIEIFDFLRGNLKFKHKFTLSETNKKGLDPISVKNVMKEQYLNQKIHDKTIRSIAMNDRG